LNWTSSAKEAFVVSRRRGDDPYAPSLAERRASGGASSGNHAGLEHLGDPPMARIAKKQPLTEIDLVILRTGATRRDRNALPWPNALKSDAKARTAAAIALLKRGLLAEVPSAKKSAAWRISPNGSPLMLIITQAGVAALGPTTSDQSPAVAAKRANTKRETIVALLQSKGGASLKDMMAATGWQAHSIRGFLSGTVAKRLGHAVRSVKNDGEDRRYHLEA
jgi:Protein of unknown function (DUF3489)